MHYYAEKGKPDEKSARSRRCEKGVLIYMSLGNWEGYKDDDLKSEDLPVLFRNR